MQVAESNNTSLRRVDIAFCSAKPEGSKSMIPAAVKAGAIVIDDSSAWRMEPDVPLVVPEVNAADLEELLPDEAGGADDGDVVTLGHPLLLPGYARSGDIRLRRDHISRLGAGTATGVVSQDMFGGRGWWDGGRISPPPTG